MRLKYDNFTVVRPALFDSLQSGFNFGRMMPVVIHHGNAAHLTFDFQPALNPFKRLKGTFDGNHGYIQLDTRRNAGRRIVDIMNSRQVQGESAEHMSLMVNAEATSAFFKFHITYLEISLGAHAIGGIAFFDFWNKILDRFIIQAQDCQTVKRYPIDEV